MQEPKAATEIKMQIRYKELRLDQAERTKTAIEKFIAGIKDSTDRQIFELYYLEGMKQEQVADEVGYSRGRISQIIGQYLKD
jgi:RNA polymerase sigma factor (sigma-70 family)